MVKPARRDDLATEFGMGTTHCDALIEQVALHGIGVRHPATRRVQYEGGPIVVVGEQFGCQPGELDGTVPVMEARLGGQGCPWPASFD